MASKVKDKIKKDISASLLMCVSLYAIVMILFFNQYSNMHKSGEAFANAQSFMIFAIMAFFTIFALITVMFLQVKNTQMKSFIRYGYILLAVNVLMMLTLMFFTMSVLISIVPALIILYQIGLAKPFA